MARATRHNNYRREEERAANAATNGQCPREASNCVSASYVAWAVSLTLPTATTLDLCDTC